MRRSVIYFLGGIPPRLKFGLDTRYETSDPLSMASKRKPIEVTRAWMNREDLSMRAVSQSIDDPGGQFLHWCSGRRSTLPIVLKVRLAEVSGIPIDRLLDDSEVAWARRLVTLMARDAAA